MSRPVDLFQELVAGASAVDKRLDEQGRLEFVASLQEVAATKPSWVIIAVPHDTAVGLACQVLGWDTQVLIEKPLGRSVDEARLVMSQIRFPNQLWVCFNYRFYPGIRQAILDARAGRFGRLINISMTRSPRSARYVDKTWKFDPDRAGGGCLIDPGIHVLDLCQSFVGPLIKVNAALGWEGFWRTGIEEEVHLLLTSGETIFNVQLSIVRWRSTFRMEIHGVDGYGLVTGRGRSYGTQTYTFRERWGWQNGGSQAESESLVCESPGVLTFQDELAALFVGMQMVFPRVRRKRH